MPKQKVSASGAPAPVNHSCGFLSGQQQQKMAKHATRKPPNQNRKRRYRRKNPPNRKPAAAAASRENAVAVSRNRSALLPWHSSRPHVPLPSEEEMVKVVIRWKKTERGMMKSQPLFRLDKIKKTCHSTGMSLSQALSLRRHHLQRLHPKQGLDALGLGQEDMIRKSAALFEESVADYLNQCNIAYHNEDDQKKMFYKHKKENDRMGPTPDFLLKEPVELYHENNSATTAASSLAGQERNGRHHFRIMWIEAKMFYGASTIPNDSKSAVGNVLRTARRYVDHFGPGAMVFSFGCGDLLARKLLDIGVWALNAEPCDLTEMERHQRTWCGNKKGEILP